MPGDVSPAWRPMHLSLRRVPQREAPRLGQTMRGRASRFAPFVPSTKPVVINKLTVEVLANYMEQKMLILTQQGSNCRL